VSFDRAAGYYDSSRTLSPDGEAWITRLLGAELGLRPDHVEDHAAYIGGWMKRIKSDKRLVVQAAGAGQKAADRIRNRSLADDFQPC